MFSLVFPFLCVPLPLQWFFETPSFFLGGVGQRAINSKPAEQAVVNQERWVVTATWHTYAIYKVTLLENRECPWMDNALYMHVGEMSIVIVGNTSRVSSSGSAAVAIFTLHHFPNNSASPVVS